MFTYQYPHPAVTVDCVVFGFYDLKLNVLLIQRKGEPFKNHWALPGGYVDITETCEDAAIRELNEETGLKIEKIDQLHAFSDVNRDPRERTISVAFCGEIVLKDAVIKAGDDAADAKWFDIYDLPKEIGFDHSTIINHALTSFKRKSLFEPIGLDILPKTFRFNDLYKLYETLYNVKINRILFKNKMDRMGHIKKLTENDTERNPMVQFDTESYYRLKKEGCYLLLN